MQMKSLSVLMFLGACINSSGDAWIQRPLVDDGTTPRSNQDLVTGIYFSSPDQGYAVTTGANATAYSGGAVFALSGSNASLAFSGKKAGYSLNDIEFTGLEPTPNGVVAMAYAADIVSGDSTGHFTIAKNGNLEGGEAITALHQTASRTTLIRNNGIVSTSVQPAGPQAQYVDVWSPEISNKLPTDLCKDGPRSAILPVLRYSSYIGHGLIAYTSATDSQPQICISTDGGMSFYPHHLTVGRDQDTSPPRGVVFTSAQNGITWWSNSSTRAYIQRTTDGGKTWRAVALPENIANHLIRLNGGFFAPDGQHGWIVGYDHDAQAALGIATTDGGETWSTVSDLGNSELYCGFALDATHVWVGGDNGMLLQRR